MQTKRAEDPNGTNQPNSKELSLSHDIFGLLLPDIRGDDENQLIIDSDLVDIILLNVSSQDGNAM